MNSCTRLLSVILFLPLALAAMTSPPAGSVLIEVIDDAGHSFPLYPLHSEQAADTQRAYLQALKGSNYALRIRNNSAVRRGLVIAVDGRNIISGQKSELAHDERMYILEPWQRATYRGWRSSQNRIHRFFFTEAEQSYAGAWQDHSAMGVIAVAVFAERPVYRRAWKDSAAEMRNRAKRSGAAPSADRAEADALHKPLESVAGTGFGDEQHSQVRLVSFKAEKQAVEKFFYKYEWRQTLCRQGIITCQQDRPNRFWPQQLPGYSYAPYPPAR